MRAFAAIDEYAAILVEHDVAPDPLLRHVGDAGLLQRRRLPRGCARAAGRLARGAVGRRGGGAGVRRRGPQPADLTGSSPVLVVDIGGGSTELILGDASGPTAAQSMDMGSVRMHERYLTADPPSPDGGRRLRRGHRRPPRRLPGARGVGGHRGRPSPAPRSRSPPACWTWRRTTRSVIDQSVVAAVDVHAFVERLVAMPIAERLTFGWMHPGRVDVLGAGGLILSRVLRRCSAPAHGRLRGRHPGRHRVVDGLTATGRSS